MKKIALLLGKTMETALCIRLLFASVCECDFRVQIDSDVESMRKQNTHTHSKLCANEIYIRLIEVVVSFFSWSTPESTHLNFFSSGLLVICFLVSPLHAMTTTSAHTAYKQSESNTENALDTQKQTPNNNKKPPNVEARRVQTVCAHVWVAQHFYRTQEYLVERPKYTKWTEDNNNETNSNNNETKNGGDSNRK